MWRHRLRAGLVIVVMVFQSHVASAARTTAPSPANVTLEPPAGLTVVRYKPHVVIAWTHAARLATGYEIERAIGAGAFRRIGTAGRDARTFRDRTSSPGTTYVYRVRAVGTGVVSPYKAVIVIVEPDSRGRARSR